MESNSLTRRPTWQIVIAGLLTTVIVAIALGAASAASLGDPWGGRVAQAIATSGGLAIALFILQRRAASR